MAAEAKTRLLDQLELADQLLERRPRMFNPQDLPGRCGRVIKAIDHLLAVLGCEAVLGGGWAVWHHGYVGRVTQDVNIVLPTSRVDALLKTATVSCFEILPHQPGRWPKLLHKDTGIEVDILPEGARPGTASRPAPTTIPHPVAMGAQGPALRYISLPSLIELKLAAGRVRDESDVVELIRAHPEHVNNVRQHLAAVHADYARAFDQFVQRAHEESDT